MKDPAISETSFSFMTVEWCVAYDWDEDGDCSRITWQDEQAARDYVLNFPRDGVVQSRNVTEWVT